MDEVSYDYKLFMKKCLVLKEMNYSNNNARFKNLRIKLRHSEK